MKLLGVVAVLCPLVSALAFAGPEITPVALEPHPQGWTPRPTTAPNFREILKRQAPAELSLIEAPDNICGYQYGESSGALALCGPTSRCGFATALGEVGEIYCYGSTTSEPRQGAGYPAWTSCVAQDLATSCLADSACSDNPGIIMCTDSSETYCNLGTFMGLGVEAVWCDSTYYTNMIPISTTYVGQLDRVLTTPSGALSTSISSVVPIASPSQASTTSPSSSSSPVSAPTPVNPIPSTPTPTPSPPSKKSTPIGPIVGGVIGGLALIVAIAAGIFFCIRHGKKKTGEQGQPAANPAYAPPPPVQTQGNVNNMYPPYQSEKPPQAAQTTYAELQQPVQQYPQQQHPQKQYPQQPPQPQYPQHELAPISQAPQQQYTQQYPPPGSPAQQQLSQQPMSGRESVVSAISSPSSPAPPYVSTVPPVPEMAANTSHHASPIDDRYEMGS